MEIRRYRPSDSREVAELFYDTVHTVNAADYTAEQLDAWAPARADRKGWDESLRDRFAVVAADGGMIVGFGDIDESGCLDRLYVHARHQGRGVGTAICDCLEGAVSCGIVTHASITAKPFFEKRGYRVIKEQQVERRGVFLTNYVMKKERGDV